jgi:hypothetical protein
MRDERRYGSGCRSEPQGCADGDHWRAAGVDGLDDLGVVDPLQVDGGDTTTATSAPVDGWKSAERVYEVTPRDTTPLTGSPPHAAGAVL